MIVNRCRACLCTKDQMNTVEKRNIENNISYKDMLLSLCNLKTHMGNAVLCDPCVHELTICYRFKIKCEQSDFVLLSTVDNLLDSNVESDFKFTVELGQVVIKPEEPFNSLIGESDIKSEQDFSSSDKDDLNQDEKFDVKIPQKAKKCIRKKNPKHLKTVYSEKNSHQTIKPRTKIKCRKVELEQKERELTSDGFKRIYECPKCLYFFKSFNMLKKHFMEFHETSINNHKQLKEISEKYKNKERDDFETEILDKSSHKNAIQNENMNTEEKLSKMNKLKFYKCLHCDYFEKNYNKMKSHILKHKVEKFIRCEKCKYRCSNIRYLRNHTCPNSTEATFQQYQCEECGHTSSTKGLLQNHILSKHSECRPFACQQCTFTAKLKSGLSQHIQRCHEKVKKFSCPTCSKAFFSSYHMRVHSLTHSGEKQHMCEHCGAAFIQKYNLLKHVNVMHSTKAIPRPYSCSLCSYSARAAHTLANHMMTHTGQTPNACHLCPFRCISSSTLQLHILRHKGERKYSCSQCSYKCYSKERLKAHERVHSGERPFQCSQCSYSAKTRQRLKNHCKSHQNEQKYHCEKCPYKANYKSNLIHHIKKNCGKARKSYSFQPISQEQR